MAHARASASAAYRWMACPGSIQLSEQAPEQAGSIYAEEGTAAHAKGAEAITKTMCGTDDPAVNTYIGYVRSMSQPGQRMIEVDLTPALSRLHPDLGGTADCGIIGHDWIEVVDYKHGAGMFVEAEDNLQLKIYALGLLLTVNKPGIKLVRATIIQPRIEGTEPIRTWEFSAYDLLEFAADLVTAAERTTLGPPILKSGSHCRFCPAAALCPELAKQRTELMLQEFTPTTDVALVAKGLGMIPALEVQIKALRGLAYNLAVQGTDIPGHKLVEKRATRKWKDPAAVVKWALLDARLRPFEPQTLISPAQMERQLIGQAAKDAMAAFVEKKSSGYALVPLDDNRPPAARLSVDEFSVIDGTEVKEDANPPSFTF